MKRNLQIDWNIPPNILFIFWVGSFLYAAFIAIFVQFIFLPYLVPSLHAGGGFMAELDCSTFHRYGVELAERIRESGWGEWQLDPGGGTGISGIAGALYAVFVPELWVMIPFNAAVHATSGLLIALIVYQIFEKMNVAVVAAIPFIVLPSAALWYSQIHKDGLTFLGWFLVFYSLISVCSSAEGKSSTKISLRMILCLSLGYVSVTASRGYHAEIFKGFTAVAVMILFFVAVVEYFRSRQTFKTLMYRSITYSATSLMLIFFLSGSFGFITYENPELEEYLSQSKADSVGHRKTSTKHSTAGPGGKITSKNNENEGVETIFSYYTLRQKIADVVNNSVDKLHYHRRSFVGYARATTARSNIDLDFKISSLSDLIRYIPRAYQILFFAPFPNTWMNQASNPSNTLMRKAAILEMIVVYIGLLGIPLVLGRYFRKKELWLILAANLVIMLPIAVIVPNVGLIFRMRYGYLMLVVGIGYSMLYRLLLNRKPTEVTA